jgi:DNA-binding transcriptional LysR family regulator
MGSLGQALATLSSDTARMSGGCTRVHSCRPIRDIKMQLSQTDRAVNLLEEKVDLAVRLASLPDSSLIATRVGLVRRVLCASPQYPETRGTPRVPEDLVNHDCIAG